MTFFCISERLKTISKDTSGFFCSHFVYGSLFLKRDASVYSLVSAPHISLLRRVRKKLPSLRLSTLMVCGAFLMSILVPTRADSLRPSMDQTQGPRGAGSVYLRPVFPPVFPEPFLSRSAERRADLRSFGGAPVSQLFPTDPQGAGGLFL